MMRRIALLLCLAWPASVAAAERTFDLRLHNGQVTQAMRTIRVTQGDHVRLRWTSDRPIVLHLHGYDLEVKVEPGAAAEMAFAATATGRFPVEQHKAQGGHSHGEAALVRIEVRPR